uniref:Uncharacterized protein n=1 Tax=Papio anubis TaxID=9555 RepID=A0A8I5NPF9_PAPAN
AVNKEDAFSDLLQISTAVFILIHFPACSIQDEVVDPEVPRKSSVRHHHRHKKQILHHWHHDRVHPRVAPTEDHSENLARKRSSKDVPGVHVVDKDTEKNSTHSGITAMLRKNSGVNKANIPKTQHPTRSQGANCLLAWSPSPLLESSAQLGDLKHLQQHMPGQTSSEEATGVHMVKSFFPLKWKFYFSWFLSVSTELTCLNLNRVHYR